MVKDFVINIQRKGSRAVSIAEEKPKIYSYEDALLEAGHGKFNIFLVLTCGFCTFGMGMENMSISIVMPYAKCDLHLTTYDQGLVNSMGFLGIVVGSHFWGFLADTWGRRKVMRISLLLGFIFAYISAFSTTVEFLIVLRFLTGVSLSGVQAATFSYVSEFHHFSTRRRAAALVSTFLPAIFATLPLLAWVIIPLEFSFNFFGVNITSWRVFLICVSLLNVYNFIVMTLLPESPKFLLSMGKNEETLDVLRTMYAVNTGKPKDQYPVMVIESDTSGNNIADIKGIFGIFELIWKQTSPLFMKPHLGPTVKLCYLMVVLFSVGQGQVVWFPQFLTQLQDHIGSGKTFCEIIGTPQEVHRVVFNETASMMTNCSADNSNTTIFQIMSMTGLFFTILPGFINFNIEKIGPTLLINIWLPISSLACLLVVWLNQFHLIALSYIIFLSCGIAAATLSAISVDLFPANIRAMATCLILMFGRIGGVGGSNLVSFFIHRSCEGLLYLNTGLILSCMLVFYFLMRQTNKS